jgi:hypothetical protein
MCEARVKAAADEARGQQQTGGQMARCPTSEPQQIQQNWSQSATSSFTMAPIADSGWAIALQLLGA